MPPGSVGRCRWLQAEAGEVVAAVGKLDATGSHLVGEVQNPHVEELRASI